MTGQLKQGNSSLSIPVRPDQEGAAREDNVVKKAFQILKIALTSSPVLHAPDFVCLFILHTDASGTMLGVVLSQVQEGKLSPAEPRYAVVEKGAMAIKWAVLELKYYLWGRMFTLITDHAPLQWIAKDTNARVTRWF